MENKKCSPWLLCGFYLAAMALLTCCSSQKFIPEGQRVLSSVHLKSESKDIDLSQYRGYVKQEPNARWFSLLKVPLGIYCLSGRDSTDALNRFFRKIGEAPVLFDKERMVGSSNAIRLAMENRGYLHAEVKPRVEETGKRKVGVDFMLKPGSLYRIRTLDMVADDRCIDSILRAHESESLLKINMPCDAGILDSERERIVSLLHKEGYYKVLKNFMSFELDSVNGPEMMDLTLYFEGKTVSRDTSSIYNRFRIRDVIVNLNDENKQDGEKTDTMSYKGLKLCYKGHHQIRPSVISEQLVLRPGCIYNEEQVQTSYRNLNNLQVLRYSVIRFEEVDSAALDMQVTLHTGKINSLSAELEGTNTSGDLGVASSVTFSNKNIFRGSEVWTTKLKGAFEAITGLEGYNDQNFFEISAETHLSFPRFILPFVRQDNFNNGGSSELTVQYDSQNRPEFHRRVLTGAWSYRWLPADKRFQNKLDVLSMNYVFMPWISETFRKEYLENEHSRSSIIRYSYENLFIVNAAYNVIFNSSGMALTSGNSDRRNTYQIKLGIESAGNVLYLLANAFQSKKNSTGAFQLFNVAFAQYVKFDLDYSRSIAIDARNSFAFHGAFGLAVPYGNATIVPFEKTYFAGGPNSIRGWSVRQLGPGGYVGKDGKVDFLNQTGNMKLLFNMEWRTHLFWKAGGAFFVDAGNIWSTRNYKSQQGGLFKLDSFYKQIAVAYGIGIRFNFDYFILRFDWGMKAVNPIYPSGRDHYPLFHPVLKRDLTFHFAVGLPF